MSDTIDRQAAIDATWEEPSYTDPLNVLTEVRDRIKALPPAQPESLVNESRPLVKDTISRQAAIDAFNTNIDELVVSGKENADAVERYLNRVIDEIKQLPPIQPEIVRCKDCKHWIPYDWMFSEVWRSKNMADYPEDEIGCNWCDMAMKADDFCSRAERREVTT